MGILKSTNSGINAKLTPKFILTFGYKSTGVIAPVFTKEDLDIVYYPNTGYFEFSFNYKNENYIFDFDVVKDLLLVEKYWFSDPGEERETTLKKILERAVKSLLNSAFKVAAKTIGANLVSTPPMNSPTAKIFWMDMPFSK